MNLTDMEQQFWTQNVSKNPFKYGGNVPFSLMFDFSLIFEKNHLFLKFFEFPRAEIGYLDPGKCP